MSSEFTTEKLESLGGMTVSELELIRLGRSLDTRDQVTETVESLYRDEDIVLVTRTYYQYLQGIMWSLFAVCGNDGKVSVSHIISAHQIGGFGHEEFEVKVDRKGDTLYLKVIAPGESGEFEAILLISKSHNQIPVEQEEG